MTSTTRNLTPAPPAPTRVRRIATLDVLRGIAVCGILFVNIPPVWFMNGYAAPGEPLLVRQLLDLFVQQRFFPLFSLLFGIGFGIMWLSARRRAARPRLVLVRRFAFLLLLGALHQLLQPGEALLFYAIIAFVVLLPMTLLPERAQIVVASILAPVLLAGGLFMSGGPLLIPGLFLLGFLLALLQVPARAERHPGVVAIALVVVLAAAVPMLLWQLGAGPEDGLISPAAFAGLFMAFAYALITVLLMHTPLRGVLTAVFAPLGRTALTCYISATLFMWALMPLRDVLGLDQPTDQAWNTMLLIAVGIIIVQRIAMGLWLRRFEQGPLEWLWRRVTWWGPRREAAAVAA